MKQGLGKFDWIDGSRYLGHFNRNNIEGEGSYWWSDGRNYTGTWRNN
jgi:hypothetical protein